MDPIESFPTFVDFFTRRVKPREFVSDEDQLISPADSRVLSFGEVHSDDVLLVKDVRYHLGEFLNGSKKEVYSEQDLQEIKKNKDNKLYSVIFYLSPGDYHRYHSPATFTVKRRNHILGHLWPVKVSYVESTPGVYEDNERVCLFGDWKHGLMTQVYVGATNVGSMTLNHEPEFETDLLGYEEREEKCELKNYSENVVLGKGAEVGMFKLGSTVVMVFEAPGKVEWLIENGQKIRFGEVFAKVGDAVKEVPEN